MAEPKDWERHHIIGQGATGVVHMAAPTMPRTVRFKNVPSHMAVKSSRGPSKAELERERSLLAKFADCPHIIRCFGHEETVDDDGSVTLHVFLELAEGGSLEEWGFPLEERLVRRYTRSILLGVKRIHDAGYVHCDLKRSNVLLVRRRRCHLEHDHHKDDDSWCYTAKVADLGMATEVKEGCPRQSWVKGTVMYLPSESARLGVQERPSDLWALGCVVLEMLGGKLPWDRGNFSREVIRRKIATQRLVLPKWLSRDAADFLTKCFKANPTERSTADELLRHAFVNGLEPEEDDDDSTTDDDFCHARDENCVDKLMEGGAERGLVDERTPSASGERLGAQWLVDIQRCAAAFGDMIYRIGFDCCAAVCDNMIRDNDCDCCDGLSCVDAICCDCYDCFSWDCGCPDDF